MLLLDPLFVACAADTGAVNDNDIDALPRLSAVEEARIGSVDDPDVGFSRLFMVDVDGDGNVYALEAMDSEIRVYDANGRFVRRIGGAGEGPGEFEQAPRFGVHGDTVWAFDLSARRITLFDRMGKVLSTARTDGLRIPLPGQYGYVFPWDMRADGTFTGWLVMVGSMRGDAPSPVAPGERVPIPRVRFSTAGVVIDTIGWEPGPQPRMQPPPGYGEGRFQITTIGSRRYMIPDPPTELPDWLLLDDGRIVIDAPYATAADVGNFAVTRIGLDDDTIYHRTFTYRPVEYTPEELDSVAARGARGFGNADAPETETRVAQNVLRAALKFPELKLPIRSSWVAQDAGVWLLREDRPGAPARWVVLGTDGRSRGELSMAPRTRPLWSRADTLWAVEYDDADVPWLVRFRIGSS